ncbi:hypothetical protein [Vibrio harveyi]|uniref:Lipoprotein n=1 Tax=Vibrio harveyi TaxID=669 RepID=A0A8B3DF20_VIBHA|nr:hypothetical protein [Vibrio harveyi]RIV99049.1 hypothetical protein DS957_028355 [Vibrio harveyi]HDM8130250.1 hypothetical protein [Vibrio harveyi]
MKNLTTLLMPLILVGCATPTMEIKTNAKLEWVNGLVEDVYIAPTQKTVTVAFQNNLVVFVRNESTTGQKCVSYTTNNSTKLDICGTELTLFNNQGIPINVGQLVLGANAKHITFDEDEELKAKRLSTISKQDQLRQEKEDRLIQLELWKLEQQKRRIEAETRAIEANSNKTNEKIDAVNDAIKSIGKGVENHGL